MADHGTPKETRAIWLTTFERSGSWLYCGTEDGYLTWASSVQPRMEYRWGIRLGDAEDDTPGGLIGSVVVDLRFARAAANPAEK